MARAARVVSIAAPSTPEPDGAHEQAKPWATSRKWLRAEQAGGRAHRHNQSGCQPGDGNFRDNAVTTNALSNQSGSSMITEAMAL
jgi:hypothetical protein